MKYKNAYKEILPQFCADKLRFKTQMKTDCSTKVLENINVGVR